MIIDIETINESGDVVFKRWEDGDWVGSWADEQVIKNSKKGVSNDN